MGNKEREIIKEGGGCGTEDCEWCEGFFGYGADKAALAFGRHKRFECRVKLLRGYIVSASVLVQWNIKDKLPEIPDCILASYSVYD